MELIKENLDNLISLWKVAGLNAGRYVQNGQFELSLAENSDWPNRLWFKKKVIPESISRTIEMLGEKQLEVTIPVWDPNLKDIPSVLNNLGFKEKFTQVGMSIRLNHVFNGEGTINLTKVSNELSARLWSELFRKAFGYSISQDVIMKTKEEITFLIGFYGDKPVGTSVLYQHKPSMAGIHSMGIIPEMRRKGFAEEILKQQLKMAATSGAEYATLQASEMGKGLYLKLGFQEQFIMRNYVKS